MKYMMLFAAAMLLAYAPAAAQSAAREKPEKAVKTASIKVYGNCGMCERRIEGALSEVEGVRSSAWDSETQILSVTYETKKVTLLQVQEKVASVGHDTDEVRAPDAVYEKLHGCCKYERPAKL